MAQIIGEVSSALGGVNYRLHLGILGISRLQAEFGQQLAPLREAEEAAEKGEFLVNFAFWLRVMQLSLERHHPDADEYIASDLLTQDLSLGFQVIQASFPADDGADVGNEKAPRARKPRGKTPTRR